MAITRATNRRTRTPYGRAAHSRRQRGLFWFSRRLVVSPASQSERATRAFGARTCAQRTFPVDAYCLRGVLAPRLGDNWHGACMASFLRVYRGGGRQCSQVQSGSFTRWCSAIRYRHMTSMNSPIRPRARFISIRTANKSSTLSSSCVRRNKRRNLARLFNA